MFSVAQAGVDAGINPNLGCRKSRKLNDVISNDEQLLHLTDRLSIYFEHPHRRAGVILSGCAAAKGGLEEPSIPGQQACPASDMPGMDETRHPIAMIRVGESESPFFAFLVAKKGSGTDRRPA